MSSKHGPFRKGTIRQDGKIFWCYTNGGREWWVSPERFKSSVEKHRAHSRSPKMRKYKRTYSISIAPELKLLHRTKYRAKLRRVPFSLNLSDITIPSVCPVLGIPLVVGEGIDNTPSIDRVKPELGYVRGNIAIISMRANMIKNNATSEELFKVAEWARSMGI